MLIKEIPLTILKITKREGVGKKSGKDYLFYNASVVDEDGNVFGLICSEPLVQQKGADTLASLRNWEVLADVNFIPKGFDIGGTLQAFVGA